MAIKCKKCGYELKPNENLCPKCAIIENKNPEGLNKNNKNPLDYIASIGFLFSIFVHIYFLAVIFSIWVAVRLIRRKEDKKIVKSFHIGMGILLSLIIPLLIYLLGVFSIDYLAAAPFAGKILGVIIAISGSLYLLFVIWGSIKLLFNKL